MGYGVYEHDHRWAGYGVPAICDSPGCGAEIDRGVGYMCGEQPGSEKGCGLFFCGDHLWFSLGDEDPQMCERCCDEEPAYEPTADTWEWMQHMLTDDSWEQWRNENPARAEAMNREATR